MTFPALLSTASAALALILSLILFFTNATNENVQEDLRRRELDLATEQGQFQAQQQHLQQQQQIINTATTLKDQVGPAVVNDLKTIAADKKNDKIKNLLTKYGVKDEAASPAPAAGGKAAPAAASPAPAAATPAKPGPSTLRP
jgi:uncharacterized protein YlxW (UPF0749 family)